MMFASAEGNLYSLVKECRTEETNNNNSKKRYAIVFVMRESNVFLRSVCFLSRVCFLTSVWGFFFPLLVFGGFFSITSVWFGGVFFPYW